MEPDLWELYRQMLRSRLFEEAVIELWDEGLISGEMHIGIGEEGIAAGVVSHLRGGDALAIDHRGTPQAIMHGLDPVLMLKEFLGRPDGLCSGMGGHMHLFSRDQMLASSGIVGASGPVGAGFALAAQYLGRDRVAASFFGEGAVNQGMLMESFNLAVVWKLPVIFVCKDNGWAITTRSDETRGDSITGRARSFGMPAVEVDGSDAVAVWYAAEQFVERARTGDGPAFLHATCSRPDGHMLGDQLLKTARREQTPKIGPLLRSAAGRGDSLRGRIRSMGAITAMLRQAAGDHMFDGDDPVRRARQRLEQDAQRLNELEIGVRQEMVLVMKEVFGNN